MSDSFAFFDVKCPCGRRFGWSGQLINRPKCPKCGARPSDESLAADQAKMDETERLMLLSPHRASGKELRQQRILAGLNLLQAAKLLGIGAAGLSSWEMGTAVPTKEQADKLAEIYQCGEVDS